MTTRPSDASLEQQASVLVIQAGLSRSDSPESPGLAAVQIDDARNPRYGSRTPPQVGFRPAFLKTRGLIKENRGGHQVLALGHQLSQFPEAGATARAARMEHHHQRRPSGIPSERSLARPENGCGAAIAGGGFVPGQNANARADGEQPQDCAKTWDESEEPHAWQVAIQFGRPVDRKLAAATLASTERRHREQSRTSVPSFRPLHSVA